MAFKKTVTRDALNKTVPYDERSSVFVDRGDSYGVGKPQPVGHKNGAKANVDVLPQKSFDLNDVKYKA